MFEDANGVCRECAAGLHQAKQSVISWYCPIHGVVGMADDRAALWVENAALRAALETIARMIDPLGLVRIGAAVAVAELALSPYNRQGLSDA